MAIRSKNKVNTNFNMSSMTDIVFLLLVFFIIASTLISPSGIDVALPYANANAEPRPGTVNVGITKDLKYYVNKTEVVEHDIESKVLALIKGEKEPSIILRAEKTVPIQNVVIVMDIAKKHKLSLAIATSVQ